MRDPAPPTSGPRLAFGEFHLDVARYRLLRGKREIPLRPKSWDVLGFLIRHPGLLVTKDTLHREIWSDTAVSDDALTKSISELRRALGDTRRTPRFIETVHGRGFRFVAEVREIGDEGGDPSGTRSAADDDSGGEPGVHFVGRQAELRRLHDCLRMAGQGERQVVFVTGEAGIGKTTLVEEFLRSPAARGPDVHVLRGQCVQQRGQREPYMPVLEALERILASPAGPPLIPLFRRMAPCWYAQIPWLLSGAEPLTLPSAMMTAPPERMLREIGAFLGALAVQATVVLVLEDLHWSDGASVDLLAFLAERRDPARLLILATFRPAEAATEDHPIREVKQTLRAHRRCVDLPLDYLSQQSVRDYLRHRFGARVHDLAPLIHRRTDGNPLFVVALVQDLVRRGQLTTTDGGWGIAVPIERLELAIPEDLREMVAAQFESLKPEEQAVLETASVVGPHFTPLAVARSLGRDAEEIESVARDLARGQLFLSIASSAEEPAPIARYDFTHALHQQAIYEQIPPLRRQRLHLSVAQALESMSGERGGDVAPELSVHFERGGDFLRASKHLGICAIRAQQRLAPDEAAAYVGTALELLERLPATGERQQRELDLRLLLAGSLHLTRGYDAPAVRANYDRARALCASVGHQRQLFEVVHVVWYAQMIGRRFDQAVESVAELALIAQEQEEPEYRLRADLARGRTELWKGNLQAAEDIVARFLDTVTREPLLGHAQRYGLDPLVAAYAQSSLGLWLLGYPDRARARSRLGTAYAEDRGTPLDIASACVHAASVELFCDDPTAAARLVARATRVCADHAVLTFTPTSRFYAGAVDVAQGRIDAGLAVMIPAFEEYREVVGPLGTDIMLGYLGAACERAERWDEGLRCVEEGIAMNGATDEHIYAAELWRVKGALLLGKAGAERARKRGAGARPADAAKRSFHRALDIARAQGARSLALRAATSLARQARRGGEAQETRALLRSLYESFTEGFDTRDLREAKALLS